MLSFFKPKSILNFDLMRGREILTILEYKMGFFDCVPFTQELTKFAYPVRWKKICLALIKKIYQKIYAFILKLLILLG
jgi:hypothetical protein